MLPFKCERSATGDQHKNMIQLRMTCECSRRRISDIRNDVCQRVVHAPGHGRTSVLNCSVVIFELSRRGGALCIRHTYMHNKVRFSVAVQVFRHVPFKRLYSVLRFFNYMHNFRVSRKVFKKNRNWAAFGSLVSIFHTYCCCWFVLKFE